MHILKYKLFESTEEENEMIEYCKDFIETFNESDEKFKITDYSKGWYSGSNYNKQISSEIKNEGDRLALRFALVLNDDDAYYDEKITINQIDESISLLNKSKFIINRLERYCSDIVFDFRDRYALFVLCFENKDELITKTLKLQKIYDKFKNNLSDYERFKTLSFVNSRNVLKPDRKNLYNLLLKENPILKELISKSKNYHNIDIINQLTLRYSATCKFYGNKIEINIGAFKYKHWILTSIYKPIKLSESETKEALKIIAGKCTNSILPVPTKIKIDGKKIEIEIIL